MGTPAPFPVASNTPGEPVPVAFIGRTSTLALQDPRASLRRQLRSAKAWLPPGWFLSAVYWDIESGGIDLENRSQGTAYQAFTDAGIPRDGGMADMLVEATSPAPKFAAVICEDIERSGRDTFNALKLEKELSRQGIPLFATEEPASIEGVNSTTVLVRRVKQGVAEWLRLQIKEKTWKGLVEHSIDGWNIGPAPYGYRADRVPHPVPVKASQGRTKTRLALDPVKAAVVEQIFTWRVVGKLGLPTIANRLNADPARYPVPGSAGGWTPQAIDAMLRNPKYTGYMVYGRRRNRRFVPADQWLWTPEPVHPAIVDRAIWDEAQKIGAGHGTSRDGDTANTHPATSHTYVYRGRVYCRDCKRRMAGRVHGTGQAIYYRCPHNPANPRHAGAAPEHPRTVQAPELRLDQIAGEFFYKRIFGPERAALLAAQLPATDADAIADRDAKLAAIKTRLDQIEKAQDSQMLELEQLPADPNDAGTNAMRARIRARFNDLHAEREHLEATQRDLEQVTPQAQDPTLLDELPLLGDILPRLPAREKAGLFRTFDVGILWNKPGEQVTMWAEITDTTLQALTGLLDPTQPGYHDTANDHDDAATGDLTNTPIAASLAPTVS